MTNKSITLELPAWSNWIAQDEDGPIWVYDLEPRDVTAASRFCPKFVMHTREKKLAVGSSNENWRESKININTHSAYIDADGILHKCELVPGTLKEKA